MSTPAAEESPGTSPLSATSLCTTRCSSVEVDDVQAYLDKATALGGKTVVPPVKIPTGTFAWFADPEGNTVGLLKRG
ncbi:MAG: VOC family protein [Ignavibacteriota bacterium]